MTTPLIFNIQKFSIHDGEGIRTTVFFKGCPLACRWCHNPESQGYGPDLMYYPDRCTGCGACLEACPRGAISFGGEGRPVTDRTRCTACGECAGRCNHNAREVAGRQWEMGELIRELERDRMFYEQSGGGITLSGGEVLAQDMDYVELLARRLWERGYSVDIDTCGHVPYEHLRRLLPYADTFLYDIKLMDPEAHRTWTGADNRLILENLVRLSGDGARISIRLPLIAGVNATDGHIQQVIRFLQDNRIRVYRVYLLKYHDAGSSKYRKLERPYDGAGLGAPSEEWLEQVMETFRRSGFPNIQTGG